MSLSSGLHNINFDTTISLLPDDLSFECPPLYTKNLSQALSTRYKPIEVYPSHATLSVWRPSIITNEAGEKELVAQIVADQVFRDTNGNPSPSRTGGLRLRLRDFATEALAGADLLRNPIIIPANKLCSLLEDAEAAASVVGQQTGIITANKPWIRKRRRKSSSPEVLTQRDEKRFRADESRAADQTRDDSSYKTGSTSEGEAS
ncbi:hypothetical protein BJ875DRAFT_524773 [Amylocarpus encephaloides]|uniref:Uncharacterized protein n=1 Tax=Amylocarpus encephaloides TaxID=45428 RepID=A0A9P8C0J9_9HELO|nr:hypothetical protein BJ875DRAFT_524773 [Amylocarpus encephaloides]